MKSERQRNVEQLFKRYFNRSLTDDEVTRLEMSFRSPSKIRTSTSMNCDALLAQLEVAERLDDTHTMNRILHEQSMLLFDECISEIKEFKDTVIMPSNTLYGNVRRIIPVQSDGDLLIYSVEPDIKLNKRTRKQTYLLSRIESKEFNYDTHSMELRTIGALSSAIGNYVGMAKKKLGSHIAHGLLERPTVYYERRAYACKLMVYGYMGVKYPYTLPKRHRYTRDDGVPYDLAIPTFNGVVESV